MRNHRDRFQHERPAGQLRVGLLTGVVLAALLHPHTSQGLQQQAAASGQEARPASTACPREVRSTHGAIWVTGQVQDAASGVPLPGAEVELTWKEGESLESLSAETSPSGAYRFCRLPSGFHLTLSASAAGRESGVHAVDTREDVPVVRQDLEVALGEGDRGRIVGRVVDRGNGRGVDAATVRLEPLGMEVTTRYDGRFALQGLPTGDYTLRLRHVAYGEHETAVEVTAERTVDVRMAVSEEPVEMEPLEVTVQHRYRPLERRGFYERMHWAEAHGGTFLTPEIIERRKPVRLSHLLGQVPMVGLDRICRGAICGNRIVIRGCGAIVVFLDGVEFSLQGIKGIDEIPMQDVRAVEVYKSAAELPAEFTSIDGHCAVVVWTKKGPDRRAPGS